MSQTAFYRAVAQAQQALGGATVSASAEPRARAEAAARVVDELVDAHAEPVRWSCRRGCAACCRHPVGVTFAEVLALAAAIGDLPPPVRVRVVARTAAAARSTAGLDWLRLAGLPCPLLEDEQCVVHGARPIACRAFASFEASACEAAARGVPVPVPIDTVAWSTGLGVASVLAAGEVAGHRELRAALAAVLGAADAAAAFAGTRLAGADGVGSD